MKQTKILSLVETLTNLVVGGLISIVLNFVLIPIMTGVQVSLHANLIFTGIFVVSSFIRGYIIRRVFNYIGT
jgi:uncharacterized membrane protein YgaE (UPF0421/DUF939 family)